MSKRRKINSDNYIDHYESSENLYLKITIKIDQVLKQNQLILKELNNFDTRLKKIETKTKKNKHINQSDKIEEIQNDINHITNEIENILGEIRITKEETSNDYSYIT